MRRVASTGMPTLRTRVRTALLAAAVSACAHAPAASAPAPASPCFVADSAAAPDTVYAVGARDEQAGLPPRDCAGNPIPPLDPAVVVFGGVPPGTDLRDVLDRGMPDAGGRLPDVVVTRDPEVLAYAARRGEYLSVPLAWDRTYVLLVPATDTAPAIPLPAERDELGRDAVQADVRGALPPLPWPGQGACPGPAGVPPAMPPAVLAYAAGDPVARQLAERVVALATPLARPAWIPSGLARRLPRTRPAPRDSIANLLAAWHAAAALTYYDRMPGIACDSLGPVPPGYAAVPLVDSRAHALVRRGSGVAFYITNDGGLRFVRGRP